MKLFCPHCGDRFTYDAALADTTFECRHCRLSVQMPSVDALSPALREEYLEEVEHLKTKEQQKRERLEDKEHRKQERLKDAARREHEARRNAELRGQQLLASEAERQREESERGMRLSAMHQTAAVKSPPRYVYKMVQVPPTIVVASGQPVVSAAAEYLQQVVNDMAVDGWEFYRVDSIGVQTPPGCLGQLFGQHSTLRTFYVISFRKPC